MQNESPPPAPVAREGNPDDRGVRLAPHERCAARSCASTAKAQLELRFLPALFFAPVRRPLAFLAAPLPAPLFLAALVRVALLRLVRFLAALFFAALFFAVLFFAALFFAVLLAALFLAVLFLAVLLFAVLFFAALLFFALERAPAFFAGTLPPALRAFESPIAIACFRLFTVLPERPLFNVPRLRSSIAFPTSLAAFLPYLAMPSSFFSMHCDNARPFRKERAQ